MNFKAMAVVSIALLLFLSSFGTIAADAGTTAGKFGDALEFDGVDDFVAIADSPSLKIPSTEITIEAWVYFAPNSSGTQLLVRKWLDADGGWASYVLGKLADNRIYGSVMNKNLAQEPTWYTNQTVAGLGIEGTWAHIAFSWKKDALTSADGKIFINGLSVPTTFEPRGYSGAFSVGYGDYPLYFGRGVSSSWQGSCFMGRLDEIRISNISRTSFSLAAPPSADAYTLGLWHFDEGAGTTASDASSHANHGAVSGAVWTGVLKQDATLTIQSSLTSATTLEDFTLSGSLSASRSGSVVIRWSINGSGFIYTRNVTMANGQYSSVFGASTPGTWAFKATWAGDSEYNPAESNTTTVSVTQPPPQTGNVTFALAGTMDFTGNILTVDGAGYTASQLPKTFTWDVATTHPFAWVSPVTSSGTTYTWSSSTGLSAAQSGTITATTGGGAVTATYSGTPVKSGCFIATATYGSEAAPQVQALRDFRDGIAMKTFAGSNFMIGFLTWYYSWSPPVADTIAPDSTAKAVMRVALQPLLNILEVATSVNSALSFNGEFAIATAGFAAASLIGLVYFLPLTTLVLVGAKRYRRNLALPSAFTVFRFTAVPWVVSVALIAAAEIALSPALMMAATAAFVICTMLLAVGTMSIWLASLYRRG